MFLLSWSLRFVCSFAGIALLSAESARAQLQDGKILVTASLISDVNSIQPGQNFELECFIGLSLAGTFTGCILATRAFPQRSRGNSRKDSRFTIWSGRSRLGKRSQAI